jgi:hypothetical protein
MAVPAADIRPRDVVCAHNSSCSSGSSPTVDTPSIFSSRLSRSSTGLSTEASSSSCGVEQQQHPSAELAVRATVVCGSRRAEQGERCEAPSLQGQDVTCVGPQQQAPSAFSSSNGSSSDSWPRAVTCSNSSDGSLAHARLLSSAFAAPTCVLIARQRQAAAAAVLSSSSSSNSSRVRSLLCMPPLGEAGRRSMKSRGWCIGQSGSNTWPAAATPKSPAAATATVV